MRSSFYSARMHSLAFSLQSPSLTPITHPGGKEKRENKDIHLNILNLQLGRNSRRGLKQHRESSETGHEYRDGGEEAEYGLEAIEGGVHCGCGEVVPVVGAGRDEGVNDVDTGSLAVGR